MNCEVIKVDRTRIETRQRCTQERRLGFHYNGIGLSKIGAKYDAMFGQAVHTALAKILLGGDPEEAINNACDEVTLAVNTCFSEPSSHFLNEQLWLIEFLVCGWVKYRLPHVATHYVVESVEKETEVVFQPSDYLPNNLAAIMRPLKLSLRLDCLLRRKDDGLLHVLDFKTASKVSEDWNTNLDNSLQSYLYINATELLYKEPVGGIMYDGLVKGYREVDRAKSSPFNGQMIQFSSPFYGWEKNGKLAKYVNGAQKVFTPKFLKADDGHDFIRKYEAATSETLSAYFPSTIPYRPLNIGNIVGQVIVNENEFQNNLEMLESALPNSPEKAAYENVLFEKTLGSCFKYGSKHPCQFVEICHGGIHEDELINIYEPRIPHHD